MFDQYQDLLTIKDLQSALQIGRNKAYQLVSSGEIQSFRVGKVIRIPKLSVIDYVERMCYNGGAVDGCRDHMEVSF